MRFSYFVVYGVDYLTRDAWDESCWQCVTKKKKKLGKMSILSGSCALFPYIYYAFYPFLAMFFIFSIAFLFFFLCL